MGIYIVVKLFICIFGFTMICLPYVLSYTLKNVRISKLPLIWKSSYEDCVEKRYKSDVPIFLTKQLSKQPLLSIKACSGMADVDRPRRSFHQRNSILQNNLHEEFDGCFRNALTLKVAYSQLVKVFKDKNISEPESSARYILCEVLSIGYRLSDFNKALNDYTLSPDQMDRINRFKELRLGHMPVQYIIGNWDFFGLTLICEPPVLIPRPETEELVQRVIDSKTLDGIPSPRILDIGVGTGAIGLALLSHYKQSTCVGIDVNPVAVNLANRNAQLLNVHDRYSCILQSFQEYATSQYKFDLIISNPPYIPSDEMEDLQREVFDYEDHIALHGGTDGADIIKDIVLLGPKMLLPSSPSREIWIEVARHHPQLIHDWIMSDTNQRNRFHQIELLDDFSTNPRFIRLKTCGNVIEVAM